MRRVAGDLLDAEVPVGAARDLRQVGDRDHLRARREPRERVGDAVRGRRRRCRRRSRRRPSSRRRRPRRSRARSRESSPPEAVSATGANGRPGVRPDQERRLVGARSRPARARRSSTRNSPSPIPMPCSSPATASANGPPRPRARRRELPRRASPYRALGLLRARARPPRPDRRPPSSAASSARASAARASSSSSDAHRKRRLRVGDPLELGLDLLEPPGSASSDVEERPQRARRLAQPQLGVAQLVGRLLRAPARAARPARAPARPPPSSPAAPSPSSGSSASAARPRPRRARSGAAAARAPRAARPPSPGSIPSVSSTSARSSASRASAAAASRVSSSCRRRAAPSSRQASRGLGAPAQLLVAAEGVEDGELVRGPREPPLLELAGHRQQPLAERGDVLARRAPAPGVRARPPSANDPPREHDALLVLRPQLGERLERLLVEQPVRQVELGLDVGLAPPGPTNAASPFAPSRRPIACARIVLPAPVSPVITFSPGANASSASRIRTRFSIRRLRSKGLAVAVEEGHLGQQREQARSLAEPRPSTALPAGRELADRRAVGDHLRASTSGVSFRSTTLEPARHDERPRVQRVRRDERDRHRVEPPDEHRPAAREVVARSSRSGVAQITPSHGWTPRSSPPTDQASSTIRPIAEVAQTTSLTATCASPSTSTSSVGSSTTSVSPANARASPSSISSGRHRREEADAAEVDADHRDAGAEEPVQRAQHRPVAAEHDREVGVVAVRRQLLGPSSARRARRRTRLRRARAARAPRRSPPGRRGVTTATVRRAQPTASSIQPSSSSGSRAPCRWTRWRKNSRFPFGPGRPESTTPATSASHAEGRLGDSREHSSARLGSRDDAALADLAAPGLELRLDEHERLPARARRAGAPAAAPSRREMNETSQATSSRRERQLGQLAGVHALEHGHARVVAQPRVQLAVADVERDHARGAALEQDVGEPARRGADVEAVEPGRVDAERVERVRELLAAARDVPRRRARRRARPPRRPARRPSSGRGRGRPGRAPAPARGSPRARARRAGRPAASSSRAR